MLEDCGGEYIIRVIEGLEEKSNNSEAINLFPNYAGWKSARGAAQFLAKWATRKSLKSKPIFLEQYLLKWCKLCSYKNEISSGASPSPVSEILDDLGNVSSDNIYILADTARQIEVVNRSEYVEIFLRGLTKDSNEIEMLRSSAQPDASEKRRKVSRLLSRRYLDLTLYFKTFPKTARNLLLTAFSLNPCKELFYCLFPNNLETEKVNEEEVSKLDFGEENNTYDLSEIRKITFQNGVENEDLQLNEAIRDDLSCAIQLHRYTAVHPGQAEAEQLRLCSKLLTDKGVDVYEDKSLNFLTIDYDKEEYKGFKSQYDPNDDGVEKAYNEKQWRRLESQKKMAELASRRMEQDQKTLKTQNLVRRASSSQTNSRGSKKRRVNSAAKRKPRKFSSGMIPNVCIQSNPWRRRSSESSVTMDSNFSHSNIYWNFVRQNDMFVNEKIARRNLSDESDLFNNSVVLPLLKKSFKEISGM